MDGTQVAGDRRIHLIGYGPSSSTIGANRAGRAAVAGIIRMFEEQDKLEAGPGPTGTQDPGPNY